MIPVFTNYRLIIDASERFLLEILFPAVIIKGTQLPDISLHDIKSLHQIPQYGLP